MQENIKHPHLKHLVLCRFEDTLEGRFVLACSTPIPKVARSKLRELNYLYPYDSAREQFLYYFNDMLLCRSFYFSEDDISFKINHRREYNGFDWIDEPSLKLKTPKIVKHAGL